MKEIMCTNGKLTQVDDQDFLPLIGISGRWRINTWGYVSCYHNGKDLCMHKQIAEWMGLNTSMITDHKDVNTLNNQRNNLREATRSESMRNRRTNKRNTTGYKNIYFFKIQQKYAIVLNMKGNRIYKGFFSDIEEAIKERDKLLKEHYGDYMNID